MKYHTTYISFRSVLGIALMGILWLASCRRETPLLLKVPVGFPAPTYSNELNPITPEGIDLGRHLFYDPILSADSSLSCSSCHLQEAGFSDPGKAISSGIDGGMGMRNSPTLSNQYFYPYYMGDGGVLNLEVMPITPMTDVNEMGSTLHGIVERLNASSFYKRRFEEVFVTDSITSQQLLFALSQFQSSMISSQSKWDAVQAGEAQFTDAENRGWNIFQAKCTACHVPPLFTDFSFANIGLDSVSEDYGRQRITMDPLDRGKFKVPNLRNVALTYPYMHDGRFETLQEVLAFYSNGVHTEVSNLDVRVHPALGLSGTEQVDVLHFLHTLTDSVFIKNPAFSTPF